MAAKNTPGFWGSLWLDHIEMALQAEAGASQNVRLAKGKNYKRRRHIENIEVSPGRISADVVDQHSYSAQLGTEPLTEASLASMVAEVVESAPLAVSLLSGELPQELAAFLFTRSFVFDCNCSSAAGVCKHGADFCWAVADLFNADPFMLLLFCGQDRDSFLSQVRSKRSPGAAAQNAVSDLPRGADPGVAASKEYKKELIELTEFKRLPRKSGLLATLCVAPPQDSGVDENGLQHLVSDAAVRAYSLVSGSSQSFLHLDTEADLVRRFANGTVSKRQLRGSCIDSETEFLNLAQAWRYGQEAGLRVTRDIWQPETPLLDPGVSALEATFGGTARVHNNCVNLGKTQLRLDKKSQWWRFVADDQLGWVLASSGTDNPSELSLIAKRP